MVYGAAWKAKKLMTDAPSICLEGSYSFDNVRLFDNIKLEIPAGQWTCLLGASGVGKSTILRLILGLETGGEFTGKIITSDGLGLAEWVSYMAQSDLLLPWLNVVDNVALGAQLRGEAVDYDRAEQLIERIGLSAHKAKYPNELSGGMRQRVALGRTLMEKRPIMLLDEPFSALDASTRADMQELTFEMLADKTVLLVTHDPAEAARLGHKIVVLSATEAQIWDAPKTPPIRDVNAADVVNCQAALLKHLRGEKNEKN